MRDQIASVCRTEARKLLASRLDDAEFDRAEGWHPGAERL
jgi:hypothetical protein